MASGSASSRSSGFPGAFVPGRFAGPIRVGLLFLVAFSVPILLAILLGSRLVSTNVSLEEKPGLYPSSVVVSRSGEVIRIDHSPALLSAADEDFLFLFSVSVAELPAEEKRVVVAAKYERDDLKEGGYGVVLEGEQSGARPLVFWQGPGSKQGRWYPFPMSEIRPGEWTLFVLSVQQNRYIGLHEILFEGNGPRSRLIGGYDLGKPIIPNGVNDLLIGDVRQTGFRGAIGTVGVLSGPNLVDELPAILKELRKDPRVPPGSVERSFVKLWSVEGQDDESEFKHRVRMTNRHGRRRGDESSD